MRSLAYGSYLVSFREGPPVAGAGIATRHDGRTLFSSSLVAFFLFTDHRWGAAVDGTLQSASCLGLAREGAGSFTTGRRSAYTLACPAPSDSAARGVRASSLQRTSGARDPPHLLSRRALTARSVCVCMSARARAEGAAGLSGRGRRAACSYRQGSYSERQDKRASVRACNVAYICSNKT